MKDMQSLTDKLTEVCDRRAESVKHTTIDKIGRELVRLTTSA